jgi:hypothetical protein
MVDTDLDAHATTFGTLLILVYPYMPAVRTQSVSRFEHHISNELSFIHKRSSKGLGTGPRLRATAVQVHTIDIRCHQGRGTSKLEGNISTKLNDSSWLRAKCGYGKIFDLLSATSREAGKTKARYQWSETITAISCQMASIKLLGENHGGPT